VIGYGNRLGAVEPERFVGSRGRLGHDGHGNHRQAIVRTSRHVGPDGFASASQIADAFAAK
jgi:hypothetical protein